MQHEASQPGIIYRLLRQGAEAPRHEGLLGSLWPPKMLLPFPWFLVSPSCSVCSSSHRNGSCTFPGVVSLQELGELLNNLFPCQAERAASLALAARAALFPGERESRLPSRALLTEPSARPARRKPLGVEPGVWQGRAAAPGPPRGALRGRLEQTNTSWHLSRPGRPGRLMGSRRQRGRGRPGFGVHVSQGCSARVLWVVSELWAAQG